MKEMERLEKAVEEERKIKALVLKLLHLNGVIAFDVSEAVLDPGIERQIKGKG